MHAISMLIVSIIVLWTGNALAEVSVELAASGSGDVIASLSGGSEGGRVVVPVGTIVSGGDISQQDLVLGQPVDVNLAPHERREVTVPAFCIHSSRGVPEPGLQMREVERADPTLVRLLSVQGQYPHLMQSAVWSYLDGYAPDDQARKVFLMAGVVPKTG